MRICIKKLKGKNHLQLVDNNGDAFYIGTKTKKNIEKCFNTIILSDYRKTYGTVKNYLISQDKTEDEAHTIALEYVSKRFQEKVKDLTKIASKELIENVNQCNSYDFDNSYIPDLNNIIENSDYF